MSLYAVKNDKGEWLGWEVYQDDPEFIYGGGSVWTDLDKAKFYAKANGGHVVELVEESENGNITSEEAVGKVFREVNRRVNNLISDDQFKFEIKTVLNAYKPAKSAKPAPEVVSQEEAKMLNSIRGWRNPAGHAISRFAQEKYAYSAMSSSQAIELERRLMRAYVIGWVVAKPKRYLVRVPHANLHYYYQKCDSGEVIPVWDMETEPPTQFTAAEIDHYGLHDCEKVEVKK